MSSDRDTMIECVTCGKKIPASDTQLFEKLEFFDDVCYCNDCLNLERQGFRPSSVS